MSEPLIARISAALSGHYLVERELGAGGMATVYLAEDLKHHRKVAIKVLKPELGAVIGAERFVREIQTAAALQHPHILGLIDSGEVDGTAYYVMPFVEGESLRDRLTREKQLPIADAVRIATEVAGALHYAHRHGVIHRDIKPENILLHDGSALVADFGIALAVSTAGGGSRMTETGMSLGTPQYMSPEQAMGEREIGPASDVYSLGCVTYEMLTGDPPFAGSTAQAIVARVVTETPRPLTAQRPTVTPAIEAAVLTALQKLPADRFLTARAFAEALADPGYRAASVASGQMAGSRRTWLLPAGLGAAAVLVGLAAWGWMRPGPTTAPHSGPLRLTVALPDSASPMTGVAISRDGSSIVYSAEHGGVTQLYRLRTATGNLDPIPGSRGARWPRISPDGRRVVYQDAEGGFSILPIEGGTPTQVRVGAAWNTPSSWLDNDHLLVDGENGVLSVPLEGGEPVQLTTRDTAAGEGAHLFASPLPPGDGILFCITTRDFNDASRYQIAAVGPHGGKPITLTPGYQAEFLPPNRLIVNRADGTIVSVPFDPTHLRVTGPPTPIVTGLHGGTFSNSGLFDVAASGRMVVESGDDSKPDEAVWVDRHGTMSELGNHWRGQFISLAISPDGSRIAADLYTQSSEEIQVRDVGTGSLVRIIDSTAQLRHPAWAPDGATLFYVALRSSGGELRQVTPGATSSPRVLLRTPSGILLNSAAPTPDGHQLYFDEHSTDDTHWGIFEMPLSTVHSSASPVAAPGLRPVPAPNDRWLAYRILDGGGRTTLMVRSTDPARGETWQVATGVESGPRWSRDGATLFYVANDSMQMASIASGPTFRVASRQALFALGTLTPIFDLAPDGRFIMVNRLPESASALHLLLLDSWMVREP